MDNDGCAVRLGLCGIRQAVGAGSGHCKKGLAFLHAP